MKIFCLALIAGVLVAGCKTSGTVETRKQERSAAYAALAPEIRFLVDQGQIKVGMPIDAVYIAWGPPSEVAQAATARGETTTWLYYGSYLSEYRFWNVREVRDRRGVFLERYLDREYDARQYVAAELTFEDGVLKSWRTLPRPPN